ncbi:deoxyribose-phosphate aldolase [Massilimaliae timonensis]|uniref:Deoxyribose-phosphate aldolase n=1 Tax=Massiliimalia timonensis TaxID=1987501 RepID=A0A8J6P879_9FIRM|nr:deoxyribose-phosphate aldolase [Massiliimalia timonensis]MBC8611249.1 deoxyribose-phosphate aldolase [Massiliimalia timonensis]
MKTEEIYQHIDHTLLKPTCTWNDIQALCEEAVTYHTASVCIPPSYVKQVSQKYGKQLKVCTVIGFPLGYHTTQVKVCETNAALEDGADEIDMVINLTDVKNQEFQKITDEIRALKDCVKDKVLKVIIETCYLSEEEKIALCHCVTEGGADYIKTSTGFGTGGATIEDVELFKQHIGPKVKIKAAGGVKTAADLEMFLNAGCDRIGTSSAVKILAEQADIGDNY